MKKLIFIFIALLAVSYQARSEETAQQSPGTSAEATCNPLNDYKDNGDGTLTDLHDGLVWQRCVVGQKWDGRRCVEKQQYLTWFEAMTRAKSNNFLNLSDWRLPTRTEFMTLMQKITECPKLTSPYWMEDLFSRTPNAFFWSITPHSIEFTPLSEGGGTGIVANFYSTSLYSMTRNESLVQDETGSGYNRYYARLVRGGQLLEGEGLPEFEREYQRLAKAAGDSRVAKSAEEELKKKQALAQQKQQREQEAKTLSFRKNLQVGDKAREGLVLEIRGKLVRVQFTEHPCTQRFANNACAGVGTVLSEKWVQRNEIYPSN
jgi:hypothetical protein